MANDDEAIEAAAKEFLDCWHALMGYKPAMRRAINVYLEMTKGEADAK